MLPFKVILIGTIRAGKSTLSKLLAERLNLPRHSMDEISLSYYLEIGYDTELAKRLYESEGFLGRFRYWKPFEAYAVERLLSEPDDTVIDLGGILFMKMMFYSPVFKKLCSRIQTYS